MGKLAFDPNEQAGLEIARAIVIERLRTDQGWIES